MLVRLTRYLHDYRTEIILMALVLFLVSCTEDRSTPAQLASDTHEAPTSSEVLSPELSDSAKKIALGYARQIEADFLQTESAIERLQSSIHTFIDETTDQNLVNAQQAWLTAHDAYELTALHRYFAAQVLNDADSLELLQLQYQINHWPIIPGYVDYVGGYPDSGIVHDINVALSAESLREQHGAFDVSEATLGFHVLEFLLWGNGSDSTARSPSDFTSVEQLSQDDATNGYSIDQLSNNRRRLVLTLVTDILLADFNKLQALWQGKLAETLQKIEPGSGAEAIVILADSMVTMLTEELLLRSLYPMLNGDYTQSIQSPYSRSTQKTVSTQLSALEGLLLDQQTEDGTTLDQILAAISTEFSEFFYQNFDASKSCLVLLYSNVDSEITSSSNQYEIEVVECINLLTNMVDHIERVKFTLID